jgi:manganese efflux pump family protein
VPTAAPSEHNGALGLAALLSWIFTAGIGAYMLRSLVAHGALRRQRSVRDGLSPRVLYGHFTLALSGLVIWAAFMATGSGPLAWVAVALLTPAIGLGICTVTLWTPYPRPGGEVTPGPGGPGDPADRGPGRRARGSQGAVLFPPPVHDAVRGRLTDATLARALTDEALAARLIDEVIASLPADGTKPARKPRVYPAAVIPFGHGLGALATFVMAVVTAIGTR